MRTVKLIVFNIILSLVAIAVAGSAFVLDRFLPFRLPEWLAYAAWPLFLLGGFIILWAVNALARYASSSGAPGDPTRNLVLQGPYALFRNPIYLGDVILILAIAFQTGSPFMLLYDVLFAILIDLYIRRVEEPRTAERFGEEYLQYKMKVPRWLPKIARRE